MPDSGTFVLGVGCQKGGTTWLSDYLAASPEFESGFKKEYHVFAHPGYIRDRSVRQARKAVEKLSEDEPTPAWPLQWASFRADHTAYFDYFAGLLTRPGIRATGDITPYYSMLPAEQLADIRDCFAERGIRTVAVFLMRDPLERVWSQARMHHRNEPAKFGDPERIVAERFTQARYADRTRYDRTLAAIDEVFAPDDVYVEFYERLFADEPVQRLMERLGLPFHDPDFDHRANATSKQAPLKPETARAVVHHFRPVYEAVAARFPDVDLPALWPSSALLGETSEAAQ